ncbi:MAG: preprotein translocase subunit SecG [Armatimonadota bacterium]
MLTTAAILVVILDVVIIVTVAIQTTKHEGLSGVIGGASSSRFRRGGWDDLLERVTKYGAIFWAVFAAFHAWLWYRYYV